jgi:hypothetical protein
MAYSSIVKPTDYFNTVLWTGNGTDDRSITGVGFKPDWVWYKERSNVGDHTVHDIVRGAGERLFTADTSAESLDANSLQAFESDGFQIGTNSDVNGNTETYVGWSWLGGGTASSNTDGSITSSVSANTTAGFSIVSYTGTGSNATVGHGIDKPRMIIIKDRDASTDWAIYHGSLGATKFIELNTTVASQTNNTAWNDTEPTSSVFSIGTGGIVNTSSNTYIAYCFAEKKGYSKFGSYTGNASTDGTFVYTGFKPAFIIAKDTGSTNAWYMFDSKRSSYNGQGARLMADASDAEVTNNNFDILSNGFKNRVSGTGTNRSGATFIYMAFAEAPFVANDSGTAVPVVAR